TSASLIQSIWPTPAPTTSTSQSLAPLSRVITSLLRRSRTSSSTLQLALLYLVRLRTAIARLPPQQQSSDPSSASATTSSTPKIPAPYHCGRRMFLAALMLASKYVHDKTYANKAWSRISGLSVEEVNRNEREFLKLIGYRLGVEQAAWAAWTRMLSAKAAKTAAALNLNAAAATAPGGSTTTCGTAGFAPVASSSSSPSHTTSHLIPKIITSSALSVASLLTPPPDARAAPATPTTPSLLGGMPPATATCESADAAGKRKREVGGETVCGLPSPVEEYERVGKRVRVEG
ncbi:hypothetical protein HK104_005083, partial [Borealophlyctis nickersoniae]